MSFKTKLSNAYQVGCEIYSAELNKEKMYFSKLKNIFRNKIGETEINNAIKTLADLGIINENFGEIDGGCMGRLFTLTPGGRKKIKLVYRLYKRK